MFKRFWWVFLAMMPTGLLVGLLFSAVVTYVMPKKYQSSVTIEVRPLTADSNPSQITPQFFGTEFEKIKSHTSLGKVADHLELVNKWGLDRETAIQILKGIITIENIRGTDLISIQVRHTDKETTRDIAAEVARAYKTFRTDQARRDAELNSIELSRQIEALENEKISLIETSVRKNRVTEGTEILPDSPAPPEGQDSKKNLRTLEESLESAKIKQLELKIRSEILDDNVVIHEEPQIAQAPASPNVTLNLILGSICGVLLSPFIAVVLIAILHHLIPARPVETLPQPI